MSTVVEAFLRLSPKPQACRSSSSLGYCLDDFAKGSSIEPPASEVQRSKSPQQPPHGLRTQQDHSLMPPSPQGRGRDEATPLTLTSKAPEAYALPLDENKRPRKPQRGDPSKAQGEGTLEA